MRIAYLECFSGISGDMFLGALLSAGIPEGVLQDATESLGLNASLTVETVIRSGIAATKVHVLEGGVLAEKVHSILHGHGQHHEHTRQTHPDGHEHRHHAHGRSLSDIRELIQRARLHDEVKTFAINVFELLGRSEAAIHNVPVEEIHFHEVGAVDAIVDIVAASAGIQYLQIDAWHSSPVNVGAGAVDCAHGRFPVPAPAAADLLRGFPTYSADVDEELTTPTGAALLRALNPTFGKQPAMRVDSIGYGAGTRNPEAFPNVLRLRVGEAVEAPAFV